MPLSTIFQLCQCNSFIDGGSGLPRKKDVSHWQTLSHNVVSSTPRHEQDDYPEKNYLPDRSHWQTLSHKVVSSTPRHEQDSVFELTTLVVIGTDYTGTCSCKLIKLPYDHEHSSPFSY